MLFEEEAVEIGLKDCVVRLNPDMLFDQPHHHTALDAVLNTGERRLVRRFPINGIYPTSFFADLNRENFLYVLELISNILESDHSESKGSIHEFHIVSPEAYLKQIQSDIEKYKNKVRLHSGKKFYIHLIENNEKPKTEEELLDLVR